MNTDLNRKLAKRLVNEIRCIRDATSCGLTWNDYASDPYEVYGKALRDLEAAEAAAMRRLRYCPWEEPTEREERLFRLVRDERHRVHEAQQACRWP